MKRIPTKIHGILDYVVAVALIFAPLIFGFTNVGGAAVGVPITLGIALFIYSLLTNYEWGVFKLIPMQYHLVIDDVAAVFLALSPWLFGFSGEAWNAWVPHLIVGLAVIVVAALSETHPEPASVRHA